MADEQRQLQGQQPVQSARNGTGAVLLSSSATPGDLSWQDEEAAVSTATEVHNAAAAADAATQQLLAAHNLLPPPPADVPADLAAEASALAAAPLHDGDAAMHLQDFEQLLPGDAFLKAQAAHLPGSAAAELAEQVHQCWSSAWRSWLSFDFACCQTCGGRLPVRGRIVVVADVLRFPLFMFCVLASPGHDCRTATTRCTSSKTVPSLPSLEVQCRLPQDIEECRRSGAQVQGLCHEGGGWPHPH